jgi:hypothetical protein
VHSRGVGLTQPAGVGADPGLSPDKISDGRQPAAKLLGDIRRFLTKHQFAAHTSTAPLEASSGQVVRHRLSRAGDAGSTTPCT